MSFDTDEASVEDGAPREGIEIKHGSTTYRIATGSRDLVINGNTFTASTSARESIGVELLQDTRDVVVKLPTSHAFTQRYNRLGNPPRIITCAIWRKQMNSGEAQRIWFGNVESCSIDGHVASFLVPSLSSRTVRRKLPVITVGQKCPYILYGAGCNVSRTPFRVVSAVSSHDGRTVRVATMDSQPDQWAQCGELVHLNSGERTTIVSQVGTTLVVQLPIQELQDGDSVHVFAGCTHTVADCRDKFDNLPNYGGAPELPRGNIFLPNGFGIYQSE